MSALTPSVQLAYFAVLSLLLVSLAPTYIVFVVLLGLMRESLKAKRWLAAAVRYYESLSPDKFEKLEESVVRRYKTWTATSLQRALRGHHNTIN